MNHLETSLAHSRPWIHFWLFGPEFGCVKRQLPIIEAVAGEMQVLLLVHRNHLKLLETYFSDAHIHIRNYPCGINLEYDAHLNLDLRGSIVNLLKFAAFQWVKEFAFFKNCIKAFPPRVIVTDFLPYIPLWAKLFRIPTIGVYNYALRYTSFGAGLLHKCLSKIVAAIFRLAYCIPEHMFIESLQPLQLTRVTPVPLITRNIPQNNEIRITSRNRFFIALGGKSNPQKLLGIFKKVREAAPELQFFIAPRKAGERLPHFESFEKLSLANPLLSGEVLQYVDGIITKAGFSTVAEALQLQKRLFIIQLDNHPEIKETENSLFELGLAVPLPLDRSPSEIARILKTHKAQQGNLAFGGEKIILKALKTTALAMQDHTTE